MRWARGHAALAGPSCCARSVLCPLCALPWARSSQALGTGYPWARSWQDIVCSLRSLCHADRSTGADILAPSIGNLHGSYRFLPSGPQFDWSILSDLHSRFASSGGRPFLCMHGTDELSDDFFRRIVRCGVSKVNINSWLREPYVQALKEGLQEKSMPEAIDAAVEAMGREAERFCDLLGSTGRA